MHDEEEKHRYDAGLQQWFLRRKEASLWAFANDTAPWCCGVTEEGRTDTASQVWATIVGSLSFHVTTGTL